MMRTVFTINSAADLGALKESANAQHSLPCRNKHIFQKSLTIGDSLVSLSPSDSLAKIQFGPRWWS